MQKLTPPSYTLLALLARQPWSAYELNKLMQNSVLRAYWPRAESHVYSEPKKLAKYGLVDVEEEIANGRKRKVYHITHEGRVALETWLKSPGESGAALEFEAMLKFISADSGTTDSMRRNLHEIHNRALADAMAIKQGIERARENSGGLQHSGKPFNGMAIEFLVDLVSARLDWSKRAIAELEQMETTADTAENRALGDEYYQRQLIRLDKIVEQD